MEKIPTWEMTQTERDELAKKIITRVADNPDGMTIPELEADGIVAHGSMYFALCHQGYLERVDDGWGPKKYKIPDGKHYKFLNK